MRASRTNAQRSDVRSQKSEVRGQRAGGFSDLCPPTFDFCPRLRRRLLAAACATALAGGCQTFDSWFNKSSADPAPSMVLKDGKFQPDANPQKGGAELNAAQEVYRAGNVDAAEKAFHKVAENTRN